MAAEICGRARGQRHCQVQRRSARKRKRSAGDGAGGAQKSSFFFSSSYFKTLDVFFRSAERGGGVWGGRGLCRLTSHRPSVRLSGNHRGKDESFTGFTGKRPFRSHSSFAHGSRLLFPDRQEEKSAR